MRKNYGVQGVNVSGMWHSLRINSLAVQKKHNRGSALVGHLEQRLLLQRKLMTLLLTGTSKSGVQYKGHVEIPNLSDENSVDEVEVCAS